MEKVLVGKVADLQPGMAARVEADGVPIAVFNVEGSYYAIADTCSHEQASLSEGYVDEDIVECPKHGAMFHIPSGEVRSLPATESVATFAISLEGDEIFVEANGE